MKKEIILIGGGGHCCSCIDVIEKEGNFNIAGIVDLKENIGREVLGYKIIASDEDIHSLVKDQNFFFITIGHIKSAEKRKEKFEYLKKNGASFPVIISPLSYVSKHAYIEEGTIIMHNVFVNVNVRIGQNCIINSSSIIEHDAVVGNHSHVSTGSVLNGNCSIGEQVFFGSNSVMVNNIVIPDRVVIGAGSVVAKSLDQAGTYVGNPLRRLHDK